MTKKWIFTNPEGTFQLENPHQTSYLYFPLVNEAGMMSAVSPVLHGDAKTSQHAFLLPPVSIEDLHSSRSARNFWVTVEQAGKTAAWSATGNSAAQIAAPGQDCVRLQAGFLWQKLIRSNAQLGLQAEVTSLVPATPDQVELMKVVLTNINEQALAITPTAAIPMYGRSADNLRDHRHVSALLHRTRCGQNGVLVRPVLSFDERGHQPNTLTYAVLGAEGDGTPPAGYFPALQDFTGEGGTLDWPQAAVQPIRESQPAGTRLDGYETIGALRFADCVLQPGESRDYVLVFAILPPEQTDKTQDWGETRLVQAYSSSAQFDGLFEQTAAFWKDKIAALAVETGSETYDRWLNWVALQPVLRRMMGNSFLPYHDYGRGGRGWRDLWQDILALLLMEAEPESQSAGLGLSDLLQSNFAGVRLDGSNATIIGSRPGEFKADRNNIPRVWMDHGVWPLVTTQLYIDQTGDLEFLLRQNTYFKDNHIHRCRVSDFDWKPAQGTEQRLQSGDVYRGTILEHLLVQHLTAFFHVGEHNNILLEGADWNDGMDMARKRGESVAFSAFYASNLAQLSRLVLDLEAHGIAEVEFFSELMLLLDRLNSAVDYSIPAAKQARLAAYFSAVGHTLSGRKVRVALKNLAHDLQAKSDWLVEHLRQQEWIQNEAGYGWFNGYYDNDGKRLEGDHPLGVRMTLTGQVFAVMGGVATDEQVSEILRAADHYLFDPKVGGYRLNTNFGEMLFNMGRCFGYAYGHKENGAVFSHMAVMFAYGLYARGQARAAYQALDSLYRLAVDFPTSRMYPGLPEYFSDRGRGMYPYLTGSASWYLLTLVTQAFGVRGLRGDLVLEPKLVREQFGPDGTTALHTTFAGRTLKVVVHNPAGLDYGAYQIEKVSLDGKLLRGAWQSQALLPRDLITALDPQVDHQIDIYLQSKS